MLLKLRGLAVALEPSGDSTGAGTVRASALVERDRADSGLANLVRLLLFATAPAHAALLAHAAAVEHGDGVVLFLGAAHAGKSTVARLSGQRRVWTDDAVLLRGGGEALLGATVGLWGSEGSEGLVAERGRREGVVKALVAIRRGDENHLARVSGAGAVVALLAACPLVRRDGPARLAALAAAEGMVRRVPVFDLAFSNRDGSFWALLERAIEEPR